MYFNFVAPPHISVHLNGKKNEHQTSNTNDLFKLHIPTPPLNIWWSTLFTADDVYISIKDFTTFYHRSLLPIINLFAVFFAHKIFRAKHFICIVMKWKWIKIQQFQKKRNEYEIVWFRTKYANIITREWFKYRALMQWRWNKFGHSNQCI